MQSTIRKYITEHGSQARDFSDGDSLLEAGVIDSVLMVGLISFLESEYGIRIEDDDMTPENFESINSIVEFIQSKSA